MTWNDDVRRALDDPDLRERADLRWLGVAFRLAPRLATDGAAALREAVPELTASLAAAPLAPGALAGAAEIVAAGPAPMIVGLGLLLSASRPERADERRERARTAATLFDAALATTPAASIAVRLARLRAELGDDAGAAAAWGEALRRDMTLAWIPPADLRSRRDLEAIEEAVLRGAPAAETRARIALRALREGHDTADAAALVSEGNAPDPVVIALATEHVRRAASARHGNPEATRAREAANALLPQIADRSAAAVLDALVAILERRKVDAMDALMRSGVDRAAAAGAADAMGEMVRRPPHDVAAVLAAAYFDALFDPLAALDVPRGLLSAYRRLVLGTVLGAMLAGPLGPIGSALAAPGPSPDLRAAIVAAVHGDRGDPSVTSAAKPAAEAGAPRNEAARPEVDAGSDAPGTAEPGAPKGAPATDRAAKSVADGWFADTDALGGMAAAEGADLTAMLGSMVRSDLSDADADGVLRTFAHTRGADRDELRIALAEVLADQETSAWIDASPARVQRATDLVRRLAPRDPSIEENREVNRQVAAFSDWQSFRYDVIVVTGYTPSDTQVATPGVHPVARERLADAVAAWKRGDAPFVLVSGGNVYPRGTPYYEAIEMKKELSQMGVPMDRIIVDARARHSTTNLRNAGRYMLAHGLSRAVIASRGGGAGPFDQTFYFAHQGLSSFDGRCERDLGYKVGELRDAGGSMVEFAPAQGVTKLNYKDLFDP